MNSETPTDPNRGTEILKRRREWLLIIALLGLILLFYRFEGELLQLTHQVQLPKNILVLFLLNLNILLIIFFLFLIFRNLFKLVFERRRGIPGAKLRSKLVAAFVALSLIPTMLLFFFSAGLITNTIENWFSTEVETAMQESLEVANTYYKNEAANAIYYANQIAEQVRDQKLLNAANIPKLRELVAQKQKEYNLGIVEVFSATHEELVRVANTQVPTVDITSPGDDFLKEGLRGNRLSQVTPINKADLIRGIVPIQSNWNPKDIVGVVVVNYYVPYSLVSKMKEISSSFDQYWASKQITGQTQRLYVIVLLLIALVIVFLATWFGFHLARGITVPIQQLAVATHRIAEGDLDVKIDVDSSDEVGMLVNAFNTMTSDLRRGSEREAEAAHELQMSNLELEQRRRYMEIVLKNVTAGVISIDRYGLITTVNKSAEDLLDFSSSQVLGQNFRDVLSQQHLPIVKGFLNELILSGKDSIRKQMNLQVGDHKLSLLLNVTTLRDDSGEFMGTVVVFDDLTHLIKAQRMAAWREVARRIAHEIKNPLTPIQLSAQRLRRRYLERFAEEDDIFDDCTGMIVRQVDELKNLVNEFSNFARLPASNPLPNNLNELISETLVLYREAHPEISLEFEPEADLPVINIDREQMKRVLINLLNNAVAAIETDGTITINTEYNTALKMVIFAVADTGTGIPAEDKPRLFEPYFSTKKSGTGLGLAIVSTIIADHNGYIRVRDNLPKGTRFIVELPATDHVDPDENTSAEG